MRPIAIRRACQRHRRHAAVLAVVTVCAAAIAVHHMGVTSTDAHHDMGLHDTVELCLAAMTAVGAAVIAVALALIALGRWRPPLRVVAAAPSPIACGPHPSARAGPALLLLLSVSRR